MVSFSLKHEVLWISHLQQDNNKNKKNNNNKNNYLYSAFVILNVIICTLQFAKMIKNKWNLQAATIDKNNNSNYKVNNKYLTN